MIPREDYFPEIDDRIQRVLRAEGLSLFGVAPVRADDDSAHAHAEYDEWIAGGLHGEMGYLARNARLKYAADEVLAGCRAVVVVGCNYYQEPGRDAQPGTGRVARYAWGRDYHNALGKRLKRATRALRERFPDETFRAFVDASPLSERYYAARAGIGYTARNTLTISSAYGSWFFLGEILTTLELSPSPTDTAAHGACPTSCFRCGGACPTGALYDHYRIDARRCISYLTIEHRGVIDEELRPLMRDWVFGCDACQEVCPLNVRSRQTDVADFRTHRAGERLDLGALLAIADETEYRRRFSGTPLLRPGRDAMVRNAAIAAANTGATHLLPRLGALASDASPLVREHARWAFETLDRPERRTAAGGREAGH